MGSYISSAIGDTADGLMLKQQDRMKEMQNQMVRRQMAIGVASARDFVNWFGAFYATISPILLAGALRSKSPGMIIPIIPLTFVLAYQYDMAYNGKMVRIREEASRILQSAAGKRLGLPDLPAEEGHEQLHAAVREEARPWVVLPMVGGFGWLPDVSIDAAAQERVGGSADSEQDSSEAASTRQDVETQATGRQ